MAPSAALELDGIEKSFGRQKVLHGISLEIRAGEFLTFLGPSGCGKTTTLRLIGGFEAPDAGRIRLGGEDVTGLPPDRRNVHTVFQHYALFPHYDVFENVAFSLRIRGIPPEETRSRVEEALSLVRLSGFERRRISELSGGQQQRVALARAVVGKPGLLLLDEPLGALDLKLRRQMQLELKRLQRRLGLTFVYVTHDQEEALTLSDRIAVFNAGRIVRLGSPGEIYDRPGSSFVADFIGSANLLEARVAGAGPLGTRVLLEGEIELTIPGPDGRRVREGESLPVAIRPERLTVHLRPPCAPAEGSVVLPARLEETVYLGSSTQWIVSPFSKSGKTLTAVTLLPAGTGPADAAQARIWLELRPSDLLVLER